MKNTKSQQAIQANLMPVALKMNSMPRDGEWHSVGEFAGKKIEAYCNGKVYGAAIIYADRLSIQGDDAFNPMGTLLSAAKRLGEILLADQERVA